MDYENLLNSIKVNGILTPIKVLKDGTILCGHNRYKIWTKELENDEEKIPYEIINIEPTDKNGRITRNLYEYIIGDNLDRRNFTMKEKIEQGILYLGIDTFKQAIANKQSGKEADIDTIKYTDKVKYNIDLHNKIIEYIINNRRL